MVVHKEAIVNYLRNRLSAVDAEKCSIFKFSSERQRDIASFKIYWFDSPIRTDYVGKLLVSGHCAGGTSSLALPNLLPTSVDFE